MLHVAIAAGVGFATGFVLSAGADLWNTGSVDWGRSAKIGLVSGVASGVAVGTFGLGSGIAAGLLPEGIAATTGETVVAGATVGYVACDVGDKAGKATGALLGLPQAPDGPISTSGLVCAATAGAGAALVPELSPYAAGSVELELGTMGAGALRASKFAANWKNVSLASAVKDLGPESSVRVATTTQKVMFFNVETNKSVIYDPQGNYFRVLGEKGAILDADGRPVVNMFPKLKADGTQARQPNGRPAFTQMDPVQFQDYMQQRTHFLNTESVNDALRLAEKLGMAADPTGPFGILVALEGAAVGRPTGDAPASAPVSKGLLSPLGRIGGD